MPSKSVEIVVSAQDKATLTLRSIRANIDATFAAGSRLSSANPELTKSVRGLGQVAQLLAGSIPALGRVTSLFSGLGVAVGAAAGGFFLASQAIRGTLDMLKDFREMADAASRESERLNALLAPDIATTPLGRKFEAAAAQAKADAEAQATERERLGHKIPGWDVLPDWMKNSWMVKSLNLVEGRAPKFGQTAHGLRAEMEAVDQRTQDAELAQRKLRDRIRGEQREQASLDQAKEDARVTDEWNAAAKVEEARQKAEAARREAIRKAHQKELDLQARHYQALGKLADAAAEAQIKATLTGSARDEALMTLRHRREQMDAGGATGFGGIGGAMGGAMGLAMLAIRQGFERAGLATPGGATGGFGLVERGGVISSANAPGFYGPGPGSLEASSRATADNTRRTAEKLDAVSRAITDLAARLAGGTAGTALRLGLANL